MSSKHQVLNESDTEPYVFEPVLANKLNTSNTSNSSSSSSSSPSSPPIRKLKIPYYGEITIGTLPFETEATAALDYISTRVPTIKGKPFFHELVLNLKSGLTVALVSLPLSISLAIAADATPVQGIITAVWAGGLAAVLGGSHYNIVGPTGALSGILSFYSVTYGSAILPILAMLTGIFSMLVYMSRLDKYLVFIPSAVMHGFSMGVAFIIAANQLNFIFGLPKLQRHPEFLANLFETFKNIQLASGLAVGFFLLSFTSLFLLTKNYGKIPWAVVLAVVGMIIGGSISASGSNAPVKTIRTQYGDLQLQLIRVSKYFSGGLTNSFEVWTDLLSGSLSITAVAVLETLMSARIADRLTKTIFNQPQEVKAVAYANLASGLAGGIPATAALARTALNIKSGATSRGSGIVNALGIMILGTAAFPAFKFLPLPIVAAILVNTAFRMLEIHEIILLYKTDFPMFVVALVTALICVVEDPTSGIVYGIFLAMIRMLFAMLEGHAQLKIYHGTRCEFQFEFDVNDRVVTKHCVKAYTKGELDEEDKMELARKAAEIASHAHASEIPNTEFAKAAHELHKAEKLRRAMGGELGAVTASIRKTDIDKNTEGSSNPHGHFLGITELEIDKRLPKVGYYSMAGYFTYVTAQSHLDRIRFLFCDAPTAIPNISVVVFSLEEVYYADPDAFDAMGDLISELARANKVLFMVGFHSRVRKVLEKIPWFQHVLSFRDYGALVLHLRSVLALEAERTKGQSGPMTAFLHDRVVAMREHVIGTGTALNEFTGEDFHVSNMEEQIQENESSSSSSSSHLKLLLPLLQRKRLQIHLKRKHL
jgi:MFS superfamily sulfate permease-like transporter